MSKRGVIDIHQKNACVNTACETTSALGPKIEKPPETMRVDLLSPMSQSPEGGDVVHGASCESSADAEMAAGRKGRKNLMQALWENVALSFTQFTLVMAVALALQKVSMRIVSLD